MIPPFKIHQTLRRALAAAVSSIALFVFAAPALAQSVNLAPMTWTQRSDWVNVKTDPGVSPHAVGDGVADDTAALQSALNLASASGTQMTVYLPGGTYKISATLSWSTGTTTITGRSIVGCGSNTTIAWYGASGGTMFLSTGDAKGEYTGIRWDGRNLAATAFWFNPNAGNAEAPLRLFNEAFLNFTGVALRFENSSNGPWSGEAGIWNCLFYKCHYGAQIGLTNWNNYEYLFEKCEFEYCDTGIDSHKNTAQMVFDTHFDHSTITDMTSTVNIRARRCTSTNSKTFFAMPQHTGSVNKHVIQDCWIDSWTNTGAGIASGAIQIGDKSETMIFDCKFTTPPNANPPMNMINNSTDVPNSILVSNNSCPGFGTQSAMVQTAAGGGPSNVLAVSVAPGNPDVGITTSLASPSYVFLDSTPIVDSTHILDVTLAYNAKKDYSADATAAIQAAITAATTANNGTIVYLPVGYYKLTAPLDVHGGNYAIEGGGYMTQLLYAGADGTAQTPVTMFSVTTPANIALRNFTIKTLDGSINTNTITETATGPGSLSVDWVTHRLYTAGNITLLWYVKDGSGVKLNNLPSGSYTYFGLLSDNLAIHDCGPAEIFGNQMILSKFDIDGATHPKTGFLGFLYGITGRLAAAGNPDNGIYDINVKDNQDLVMGDYYNEQSFNNLNMEGDAATWSGRVTFQVFKRDAVNDNIAINVNNYKGRLFYGPSTFYNASKTATPTRVNQTGANAIDLILALDNYGYAAPAISILGAGHLIEQYNDWNSTAGVFTLLPNAPTTLTSADYASMAAGLDHLRQLGLEDLDRNVFKTPQIWDEAEDLAVAAQTAGITVRVGLDGLMSAGAGSFFDATAASQFVTYDVPNVAAGTYDVRIGVKEENNKGQWQLAISRMDQQGMATNVGPVIDEGAAGTPTNPIHTVVDLGNWTPGSTSDKAFKFTVVGKNAGSTGYGIVIDYIQLIPQ